MTGKASRDNCGPPDRETARHRPCQTEVELTEVDLTDEGIIVSSNMMKAAMVREFSDHPLEICEIPVPGPAAGEILVKVDTAGVVLGETIMVKGNYQVRPSLPFVAGAEFSGTVVELGAGAEGFTPGDKVAVCGFVGDARTDCKIVGSLAEFRAVPTINAIKVPDTIPLEQAALFRSNTETSYFGLYKGNLKPGETLLVLGASGGVGFAAVQCGKLMGARVIASCSSAAKRQIALDGGADVAIDSLAPDWREQVDALTGGKGLDVVYDPVGGDQTERAFRALGWDGRLIVIGFAAGSIPKIPANLALLKGASLVGGNLLQGQKYEWEETVRQREQLMKWFGEGKLTVPPVTRRFPLERAQEAYDLIATGTVAGRIVVKLPGSEGA